MNIILSQKNPIGKFNGEVSLKIIGLGVNDRISEVSIQEPVNDEEIKYSWLNKNKRAEYYPSYWNHYFYLIPPNIILLRHLDHHIDGAVIIVRITTQKGNKKEVKSNKIRINYSLETSTEYENNLNQNLRFKGRDVFVLGNEIVLNLNLGICHRQSVCSFGFCREGEDSCKLYDGKRIDPMVDSERLITGIDHDFRINRTSLNIERNLEKLLGSTVVIKIGRRVMSTKPISYGDIFTLVTRSDEGIRYSYNSQMDIDRYTISLLSNDYPNPYDLCSCVRSTETCYTLSNDLVDKCSVQLIKLKSSPSGIIMFSVPYSYTSRDLDALYVQEVIGPAGYIQI